MFTFLMKLHLGAAIVLLALSVAHHSYYKIHKTILYIINIPSLAQFSFTFPSNSPMVFCTIYHTDHSKINCYNGEEKQLLHFCIRKEALFDSNKNIFPLLIVSRHGGFYHNCNYKFISNTNMYFSYTLGVSSL